jgi:hypothetical protein
MFHINHDTNSINRKYRHRKALTVSKIPLNVPSVPNLIFYTYIRHTIPHKISEFKNRDVLPSPKKPFVVAVALPENVKINICLKDPTTDNGPAMHHPRHFPRLYFNYDESLFFSPVLEPSKNCSNPSMERGGNKEDAISRKVTPAAWLYYILAR